MPDQLQGIVQKMIDAGESEDNIATVIQHFKTQPQPTTQPQVRSRTGQMYTPPTDDGSDFVQGAASNVDPRGYVQLAKDAYNDPLGTAKNVALSPLRLVGRMITNPEYTAGQLTGAVGLNAGLGMLRGIVNPQTVQGVSVADLKAAGVGDNAINATVNGRTPLKFPQPTPKPPMPSGPLAETSGNLALKPQPVPSEPPPSSLGTPRVISYKNYSDNFSKGTETPWSASSQFGPNAGEWASGETPGSAEAVQASGLHRETAAMDSRFKYLMDSPNGFARPSFLVAPGRAAAGAIGAALAQKLGLPYGLGMAAGAMSPEIATGVARGATSPVGAAALRAAILARLTSANQTTDGATGTR